MLRVSIVGGLLLVTVIAGGPLGQSTSIAWASGYPACGGGGGGNWGTHAKSGSGNNTIGTGVQTNSWANWSVYNGGGNQGVADDAAWLYDTNDNSQAIEAGFYTGYAYTWPYTSGMLPYYTTSDGEYHYREAGDYIPASTSVWMAGTATYNGNTARAYVYNQYFNLSTYHVSTPRTNLSQGETDPSGKSWMSGGAGEAFDGYYQDTSYNFNSWGFNDDCADGQPGYWVLNQGAYAWQSGGYNATGY